MILPQPTILWTGTTRSKNTAVSDPIPCRLVRRWVNMAASNKPFTPTPEVVFEAAPIKDAMGQPVWQSQSIADLPRGFFDSVYPLPEIVKQEEVST